MVLLARHGRSPLYRYVDLSIQHPRIRGLDFSVAGRTTIGAERPLSQGLAGEGLWLHLPRIVSFK